MTKTKEKQMLQVGEVLNMLGISKMTLRKLMRTGEINFYKVGQTYRFSVSDIIKFIENNKNKVIKNVWRT